MHHRFHTWVLATLGEKGDVWELSEMKSTDRLGTASFCPTIGTQSSKLASWLAQPSSQSTSITFSHPVACPHSLITKCPLSCVLRSLELRTLAHIIKNIEDRTVSTPCYPSGPQRPHPSHHLLIYTNHIAYLYPPLFTSLSWLMEYVLQGVLWLEARLSPFQSESEVISAYSWFLSLHPMTHIWPCTVWSTTSVSHLCLLMLPVTYLIVPKPLDPHQSGNHSHL